MDSEHIENSELESNSPNKSPTEWRKVVTKGKHKRASHGSSGHASPENLPKTPRHEAHSTLKHLENIYGECADKQVGTCHVSNEELQKILTSGCFSTENIASEVVKYTTNASELIRQLSTLSTIISDGAFKKHILKVSEAILIRLNNSVPETP